MKHLAVTTLAAVLLTGCGGAPPEPEIDIWTATSQGAVALVQQHIAYGTDLNGTFVLEGVPGSGGSPLHIACLAHQHEVLRLLLANGANVDQKAVAPDPFGGTPLHWAAAASNPVAVEALLEAGANVQSTDDNGATPLDAVLFDLQTFALMDPADLSAEKQKIYATLREHGSRHGN